MLAHHSPGLSEISLCVFIIFVYSCFCPQLLHRLHRQNPYPTRVILVDVPVQIREAPEINRTVYGHILD